MSRRAICFAKIGATNRGSRFVSQIICISEISYRSEQSSNNRKIARVAPILTIFGPIESQRHDLFLKNNSNETNESFPKVLRRHRCRHRRRLFSGRYKSDTIVTDSMMNPMDFSNLDFDCIDSIDRRNCRNSWNHGHPGSII